MTRRRGGICKPTRSGWLMGRVFMGMLCRIQGGMWIQGGSKLKGGMRITFTALMALSNVGAIIVFIFCNEFERQKVSIPKSMDPPLAHQETLFQLPLGSLRNGNKNAVLDWIETSCAHQYQFYQAGRLLSVKCGQNSLLAVMLFCA